MSGLDLAFGPPTTAGGAAPQPGPYDWLANLGLGVSAFGIAQSAVGAFYSLRAQQGQMRMEARNAEFAATQANIAARRGEEYADAILRAGEQDAHRRNAMMLDDVAEVQTSAAASGIELGSGNVAETERSVRWAAEVDKRTLRSNAQQRADAARADAANMRAGSLLTRASAVNMRRSAATINPAIGALGAAVGGGRNLIGDYLAYSRLTQR